MTTIFNENFDFQGEQLINKIKLLLEEGKARKITIHDKDQKEVLSFPLAVGMAAALLAPRLAAVGAMIALVGECSISVEHEEEVLPEADSF